MHTCPVCGGPDAPEEMANGLVAKPIPGTKLQLGPYWYILPSMLLEDVKACIRDGSFKAFSDLRSTTDDGIWSEAGIKTFDAVQHMAYLSLKRNYPGITKDEVVALIDLAQYGPVQGAILEMNRMEARPTTAAPATATAS